MKNSEKSEIAVRPDLPLVEVLQSKILNLTKSLPGFKHSKKIVNKTVNIIVNSHSKHHSKKSK